MTSGWLITIAEFTWQTLLKGIEACVQSSQSKIFIHDRISRCWCCRVCCQKTWRSLTALTRQWRMHLHEDQSCFECCPASWCICPFKGRIYDWSGGGRALTIHFHYSFPIWKWRSRAPPDLLLNFFFFMWCTTNVMSNANVHARVFSL